MLPSLSRALRIALAVASGVGFIAVTGHHHAAYAADDDDDEGGDDDSAKSKDDDSGDSEGEDEDEDDKDQPAVTAGGLFTLKTYPVSELLRPLTITKDVAQARFGVGTDVSNKGAFESAGVNIDALYGYTDNFMILGGFDSAYNVNQFQVYGGFEGALAYDMIDFRLAARIGRGATPVPDMMDPNKIDIVADDVKAAVDIGFPFRYVAKPEIAIIALNTLMSVDFNGTPANKAKPDLDPSLGIATNPIPQLSLVVFAQLQVVDFDFTNNLRVPATARVEFSPNNKWDVGGEFTLLNVKPAEGQGGPFDARFLTLFIASRFGK